jgi:hypothetical protein
MGAGVLSLPALCPLAQAELKTSGKSTTVLQDGLYCRPHALTVIVFYVVPIATPVGGSKMATFGKSYSQAPTWKELYVAALMEANDDKMSARIDVAESAIVLRAKELSKTSGDHVQEEGALDDALCALHALKSCLEIHGRLAATA